MIILSHITALCCLRHLGAEFVARLPRTTLASLEPPRLGAKQALAAYQRFALSISLPPCPIHLLRPLGHPVWEDPAIATHFASDARTAVLVRVAEGVYAPAPEYLLRQLSAQGSVVDLVQLTYELCGVYAHPSNQRIELKDRKSFTTTASVRRYLAKCRLFPGSRRLEQALSLSRDRSASHMETACAMLLGFPYRLGGLNFPAFEMNRQINFPRNMRAKLRRARCYGDLCWYERRLILEYESNEMHVGAAKIAVDSDRRNALIKIGFKVVTLTGNQMFNHEEFLRTARILADALGHRIQPRCAEFRKRHHMLRWAVLNDQASIFKASGSDGIEGDLAAKL